MEACGGVVVVCGGGVVVCGGVWRCSSGVWRWCSGVWRRVEVGVNLPSNITVLHTLNGFCLSE